MSKAGLFGVAMIASTVACGGAVIEPGHRGLMFDPHEGGLHHEVLEPGYHRVSASARVDDFPVVYDSHKEVLHVLSVEGISIDVQVEIVYRPIIAELYELDSEIGPNYYAQVVGPEFRAASRSCFGRHSILDLPDGHVKLEDEVETDVRQRLKGKHIEIASVTFDSVQLPPEVVTAIRDRVVAENVAKKHALELDARAKQEKAEADAAWEKEKLELQRNAERRQLQRAAEVR